MTTEKSRFIKIVKSDILANTGKNGLKALFYAILFSPGFSTIFFHRVAQRLLTVPLGGKILAKILWRLNTSFSGCHISLHATIDTGLRLPHPIAVVIGDGVKIGRNVTIYQSVTLGTSNPSLQKYPTIGNGVTIFTGAVIVGDIYIGDNATLGANTFIVKDVYEGHFALSTPTIGKATKCR